MGSVKFPYRASLARSIARDPPGGRVELVSG